MGQIREGAARQVAMHDTTELEQLMRLERQAFFGVLVCCAAFLVGLCWTAGVFL